MYEVLGKFT